jgi:EAL domain-containing protein (putative c-di-GMP-specific phosphodiesterase class I)
MAAATDCQLLVPIGQWVMSEACAQARRWLDSGVGALPVAVNVSIPQIQPELPDAIQRALSQFQLPPSCLQLEITESLLVRDLEKALSVLTQISDTGVRIAIKNFGTGYTPPSLLKTLPISILKIDQSFLRGLGEDPEDAAIVSAIIAMARALALRVAAEGVENEKQLAMLYSVGCDEYQGSKLSEPLLPDEVLKCLRKTGHTSLDFA